jgi:uncharacterized protein YjeT (DUF2065 family)
MSHSNSETNLAWGVFLLRVGLGIFVMLCASSKLIEPAAWQANLAKYYFLNLPQAALLIIGVFQFALGASILLGLYKSWSYGLGLLFYLISMVEVYDQFVNSSGIFGVNFSFAPLLFGFLALYILKPLDTKWVFEKKRHIFSESRL